MTKLESDFLDVIPKAQFINEQIDRLDLLKFYKLLFFKSIAKRKDKPQTGRNIFKESNK